MKNINKETWRYLDNNIPIKNNLFAGLINVRALAKKIIEDLHLDCSVNAVISAIRRYQGESERQTDLAKIYKLLRKSRLSTKTKLASILLKKNKEVRSKLANIYAKIEAEDLLRIFEVTKYIKVIIDEKSLKEIKSIFTAKEIVSVEKNIGELSINYDDDITKVPGVFALLTNELAANRISIIDSMICHFEHIIIVKNEEIKKAFNVIFNLIN